MGGQSCGAKMYGNDDSLQHRGYLETIDRNQ